MLDMLPTIAAPYPWAAAAIASFETVLDRVQFCPLTGCWFWTGAVTRGSGNKAWYASISFPGSRAAGLKGGVRGGVWSCVVAGKMVPGMHPDHKCKHTLCVNWDHLEVVPPRENALRRWGRSEIPRL